jgi:hypothetical protein
MLSFGACRVKFCLQFVEASLSAIATTREGYVPATVVEEKMADLQRRLNEALKVVQERSVAADWQRKAKDAESKLAAERATVVL